MRKGRMWQRWGGGVSVLCEVSPYQEPVLPCWGSCRRPFATTLWVKVGSLFQMLGSCELLSPFWFARMNATVEMLGNEDLSALR